MLYTSPQIEDRTKQGKSNYPHTTNLRPLDRLCPIQGKLFCFRHPLAIQKSQQHYLCALTSPVSTYPMCRLYRPHRNVSNGHPKFTLSVNTPRTGNTPSTRRHAEGQNWKTSQRGSLNGSFLAKCVSPLPLFVQSFKPFLAAEAPPPWPLEAGPPTPQCTDTE